MYHLCHNRHYMAEILPIKRKTQTNTVHWDMFVPILLSPFPPPIINKQTCETGRTFLYNIFLTNTQPFWEEFKMGQNNLKV